MSSVCCGRIWPRAYAQRSFRVSASATGRRKSPGSAGVGGISVSSGRPERSSAGGAAGSAKRRCTERSTSATLCQRAARPKLPKPPRGTVYELFSRPPTCKAHSQRSHLFRQPLHDQLEGACDGSPDVQSDVLACKEVPAHHPRNSGQGSVCTGSLTAFHKKSCSEHRWTQRIQLTDLGSLFRRAGVKEIFPEALQSLQPAKRAERSEDWKRKRTHFRIFALRA